MKLSHAYGYKMNSVNIKKLKNCKTRSYSRRIIQHIQWDDSDSIRSPKRIHYSVATIITICLCIWQNVHRNTEGKLQYILHNFVREFEKNNTSMANKQNAWSSANGIAQYENYKLEIARLNNCKNVNIWEDFFKERKCGTYTPRRIGIADDKQIIKISKIALEKTNTCNVVLALVYGTECRAISW